MRNNTLPVDAGSMPYVGMRPYGREEKDWFYGRSADGRIIADKILSARLTLLYALSGVGKSSVLNASTIPALEWDDCCVMYFDAWAGSDPAMAIKEKLAAMATLLGVVEPLAGAPTISELARLVTGNGKTLVLVFDQFEEFLVNHADALDPLRKEVAALVRAPTIDARVLICLREEFLAALEPFRQEILTLFQSTYRLEPLAAKDVRDDIVKPALHFDGEMEPALAQRLIDDLSEGQRNVGETVDAAPATTRDWLGNLRKRWLTRSVAPSAVLEARAPEPSLRTGVTGTIDLPMLQLVCEQMWRAAPATDGLRKLTLDLYEKDLGGKDKILNDHIRSCMPARWRDRLFTAKLMLYMAPPSGMKISYSAADLAAYSALDKKRVEAELVRLSGADTRILRRREYHRDVRYELQHDALVRHVAPWRDDVLEKAAIVGWVERVGAVAVVVIGLIAWTAIGHRLELRRNTDGQIANLKLKSEEQRLKIAPAILENIADYLLLQEQGTARLDHLKRLLEQNVQLLPTDYAMAGTENDSLARVRLKNAPFVLRYSQDRVFDVESFSHAWSEAAQRLTRRWGIPVPQRIALIADPSLTANQMYLDSSRDGQLLSIEVEAFDERALVLMKDMTGPAKEFFERFKDDWIKPRLLSSDQWWVVPRWSLPVWRGLSMHGGGAYPAYALEAELQKNPSLLLTPAATYFLVKHVATQYPCTAAETWARRGDGLKQDLAAFARGQSADQRWRPLTHPHLLFDLLATTTDEEETRRLASRSDQYLPALDATRRGNNWPLGSAKGNDCALPIGFDDAWDMTAFGNAQAWLPPLQPKVRLSLGAELISAWSAASAAPELSTSRNKRPGTTVAPTWATSQASQATSAKTEIDRAPEQSMARSALPALTDAFERHRRQVYARSGVWLPDASFVNATAELAGPRRHQFRIALLDAPTSEVKPEDAGGSDSAAIARVMTGLDVATSPAMRAWIDAEFVGGLLGRDDALKNLVKNWTVPSVTDLTLLLREVVAGGEADATTPDGQVRRTIRDPAWLLTSLVFWKSYYENGDPKNPPKDLLMDLAGHLRRLGARKAAAPKTPLPDGATAVLERGITALYAGRYKEAEQLFGQALKMGSHREVADIFSARYSARWGETVRLRANALCEEQKNAGRDEPKTVERYKPKDGLLNNPMLQVELQSWLDGHNVRRDPKEFRNLGLCLLSSMPETMPMAKDELLLSTATRYGEPKDWPQAQAWWFALELLRRYDPIRHAPDLLKQGTRFMDSVAGRFKDDEATTAFSELSTLCDEPGPKAWCWQLLPKFAQATRSPWVALNLTFALIDRPADAGNVQQWLARATELARKHALPSTEQKRFDFFVTLAKTKRLMDLGEDIDQKVLLELDQGAAAKANKDLKLRAVLLAIDASLRSDRQDRARLLNLVKQGQQEWPDDVEILADAAIAGLQVGDPELVKQAVDKAYLSATDAALSPGERAACLFITSYAGLVTNHKDAIAAAVQFIRSERVRYAPLIAMLLHTRTDPKQRDLAKRRLEELWRGVDVRSWDARLRGGDERVWHEMLLGYFKGAVSEADIFGPLRDESTFQASKLAGLGFTRLLGLTEANFYDALRRKVNKDDAGAQESLKRVVKSGSKQYIEYSLAMQLLRNDLDRTTSATVGGTRR